MRTVHEVSKLAGVSIRTLQYYDKIGLLKPCKYSESGYRLYDDANLVKLQQILLFRELEFPLKAIKEILESPNFDKSKALEQQIELLLLKRERLDALIDLARNIKDKGVYIMNFTVFDTRKMDEYKKQAKDTWGNTEEYKEYEAKSKTRTNEESKELDDKLMSIFEEFGSIRNSHPASEEAGKLVQKLQTFITTYFYHCSKEILTGLGKMYAAGGEFTQNIDRVGGSGTAEFVKQAIEAYCA